MSGEPNSDPQSPIVPISSDRQTLVIRSSVPADLPFDQYKTYLREDFWFACAYCTISEAEASAIRFTIDHYEPKSVRPDLTHSYDNLMYCCDACNTRKGGRAPSAAARDAGFRFFRPDHDVYFEHFKLDGLRVSHISNTGYFTIEALDLNRHTLMRLRDIRSRLSKAEEYMVAGVKALRNFPLDQLPGDLRAYAQRSIGDALNFVDRRQDEIDSLLRQFSESPLSVGEKSANPEVEVRRQKIRKERLNALKVIYPGQWSSRESS